MLNNFKRNILVLLISIKFNIPTHIFGQSEGEKPQDDNAVDPEISKRKRKRDRVAAQPKQNALDLNENKPLPVISARKNFNWNITTTNMLRR